MYIPANLKQALKRLARRRGQSEAELLREAVARLTIDLESQTPTLPLFRATGPSIAEDVDGALERFGLR